MSYIIRQNHTITLLSNQKINTHKVNGNIKKIVSCSREIGKKHKEREKTFCGNFMIH